MTALSEVPPARPPSSIVFLPSHSADWALRRRLDCLDPGGVIKWRASVLSRSPAILKFRNPRFTSAAATNHLHLARPSRRRTWRERGGGSLVPRDHLSRSLEIPPPSRVFKWTDKLSWHCRNGVDGPLGRTRPLKLIMTLQTGSDSHRPDTERQRYYKYLNCFHSFTNFDRAQTDFASLVSLLTADGCSARAVQGIDNLLMKAFQAGGINAALFTVM